MITYHQKGILIFILIQCKHSLIILELNNLIRRFLKKKVSKKNKDLYSALQIAVWITIPRKYVMFMFIAYDMMTDILLQYKNV